MKKWIKSITKALVALGLLLTAGQVFAMKTVRHEIIIPATPEQVWAVISDISRYSQWNPTLKPRGDIKQGALAVGDKIKYEFTDSEGNKTNIAAKVKQVIPNQLLSQKGGIPGFITYHNYYTLEPLDGGAHTKLTIREEYRGIYVCFWDTTSTEQAYGLMNEAVAKQVVAKLLGN